MITMKWNPKTDKRVELTDIRLIANRHAKPVDDVIMAASILGITVGQNRMLVTPEEEKEIGGFMLFKGRRVNYSKSEYESDRQMIKRYTRGEK